MNRHPSWIEELIDARVAESLERDVLRQIDEEFGADQQEGFG